MQCILSSVKYTQTIDYSEAFLSGKSYFNSHYISASSSNKINRYISVINSNSHYSISKNSFWYLSSGKSGYKYLQTRSYYNSLSINTQSKNYISVVNSYTQYLTSNNVCLYSSIKRTISSNPVIIHKPTPSPTQKPLSKPSPSPSFIPTLSPTLSPTFSPSLSPTQKLSPIISFDTKISFNNYNSPTLDDQSQIAIIVATSKSMNISRSFVKYIGTSLYSRRRLMFFKMQGYNIMVLLQINIPLSGSFSQFKTNPEKLYTSLTTKLGNSVNSGNFTQYLQAISSNFTNTSILSVEYDKYVVINPDTDNKKTPKTDFLSIIYVILFSFGVVVIIKVGYDGWEIDCFQNRQNGEPLNRI